MIHGAEMAEKAQTYTPVNGAPNVDALCELVYSMTRLKRSIAHNKQREKIPTGPSKIAGKEQVKKNAVTHTAQLPLRV
jgi:hypothetical protein